MSQQMVPYIGLRLSARVPKFVCSSRSTVTTECLLTFKLDWDAESSTAAYPADSAITDHGRQAGSGLSGPSVRRSPPDSTRLHKRPATGVSYFLGLQAAGQLLVTKKDLTLETILIRLARK